MTQSFDPNAASTSDSGIFGLPFAEAESRLVITAVPWEVTTSYGGGAARAPEAVLGASRQVDLFDLELLRPYAPGIFLRPARPEIAAWNAEGKALAQGVIEAGGRVSGNAALERALQRTNELGELLNELVKEEVRSVLAAGKIPAVLGGDHASPFGAISAVAERERSFGILHVDAHSDTRHAFEGFTWSHASILRNVLDRVPAVTKLVQIGVRDLCEEEWDYLCGQGPRARLFFERDLGRALHEGEHWTSICARAIAALPDRVWISFDVDGLDPSLCPHTGTPVPGGLSFREACALLRTVVHSGRTIIGFDLCEVVPGPEGDEWDANVGARLLWELSCCTFASQGLVKARS